MGKMADDMEKSDEFQNSQRLALKSFFKDDECEINITDSKRNENGVLLFKVRCCKYVWAEKHDLENHQNLISEYWRRSEVLAPRKSDRKRKRSQPQSTELRDDDEEEDDTGDDDDDDDHDDDSRDGDDDDEEEEEDEDDCDMLTAEQFLVSDLDSVSVDRDNDGDQDTRSSIIGSPEGIKIELSELTEIIKCSYCDEKFAKDLDFKNHFLDKHKDLEYVFHCAMCDKVFRKLDRVKRHALTHTTARLFACTKCNKSYRQKESLTTHNVKFHSYLKCKICHKATETHELLEEHYSNDHDGKTFKCRKCETIFESSVDCNDHYKSCAHRFQCTNCEKSFANKTDYRMHEKIHDGTNPHYCKKCDKYFLKRNKLQAHLKTHSPKKRKVGREEFSCEECDKKFIDKRCYAMHVKIHEGTCPFYCTECDHYFGTKTKLELHNKSRHCDESPHVCTICDRRFKLHRYLKEHIKSHEEKNELGDGRRKFRCKTCQESFERISELKKHLEYSSSCTSLDCEICKQKFQSRKRLNCHLKIHSVDRNVHACTSCSKRFRHKADLTRHMRIHSVELQFPCSKCDKTFLENWELKAHNEWHETGRHPFQCPQCDKILAKHSKLQAHIRQVHNKERDYVCDTCGKEYSSKTDLKKHERTHDSEYEAGEFVCMICGADGFTKEGLDEHQLVHLRVETSNTMVLDFDQVTTGIQQEADVYVYEIEDGDDDDNSNQDQEQITIRIDPKHINVPSLLNSHLDTHEILAKMEQENCIDEKSADTIQETHSIKIAEQNPETSHSAMEQILESVAMAMTMAGDSSVTTVPVRVLGTSQEGTVVIEEESVYPRNFAAEQTVAAMQRESSNNDITYSSIEQVMSSVPSNQVHLLNSVHQLLLAAREGHENQNQNI